MRLDTVSGASNKVNKEPAGQVGLSLSLSLSFSLPSSPKRAGPVLFAFFSLPLPLVRRRSLTPHRASAAAAGASGRCSGGTGRRPRKFVNREKENARGGGPQWSKCAQEQREIYFRSTRRQTIEENNEWGFRLFWMGCTPDFRVIDRSFSARRHYYFSGVSWGGIIVSIRVYV